jgi:membrane protein required for colicin V production
LPDITASAGLLMPFSVVDLVVVGLILISALLAMIRGFTREALAIASWVVAAIVAYFFHRQFVPLAMQYVSPREPVAIGVAAGGLFLITLIVAYFITARFSDMILESRIGALDRTLGFIFGAARGFLIAVVGYGFFQFFAGQSAANYPWVQESRMMPILQSSYASLAAVLPDNLETWIGEIRNSTGLPLGAPDQAPQDQPAQPSPPAQPEQPQPQPEQPAANN